MGLIAIAAAGAARAQLARTDVLDPRALTLGDGKVSVEPRRGYVYSCQTRFRGGGAQHSGDWIRGATWDATRKLWVQGEVAWPDARFTIEVVNGERRVTGNGLPINHTTGTFPIQRSDPAFQIDRNPNGIQAQQLGVALPLAPVPAAAPTCVPMGMIGVALSGVALYNALDDAGRDAVAHEVQDRCNGHPQMHGEYHYHGPSACLKDAAAVNTLIGYALDGYGITSMYDERGRELTNVDLDECHGRVSTILWDGKLVRMYHYVLTREYPYTLGCFRGTPVRMQARFGGVPGGPSGGSPGAGPRGPRQPPAEAQAACAGLSSGSACRFTSPRGDTISGSCGTRAEVLACVPDRR
jgi:hypothetical protein